MMLPQVIRLRSAESIAQATVSMAAAKTAENALGEAAAGNSIRIS